MRSVDVAFALEITLLGVGGIPGNLGAAAVITMPMLACAGTLGRGSSKTRLSNVPSTRFASFRCHGTLAWPKAEGLNSEPKSHFGK